MMNVVYFSFVIVRLITGSYCHEPENPVLEPLGADEQHCPANPETGEFDCTDKKSGTASEENQIERNKYQESAQKSTVEDEKKKKKTEGYSPEVLACAENVINAENPDMAFLALYACDPIADSVKRYLRSLME